MLMGKRSGSSYVVRVAQMFRLGCSGASYCCGSGMYHNRGFLLGAIGGPTSVGKKRGGVGCACGCFIITVSSRPSQPLAAHHARRRSASVSKGRHSSPCCGISPHTMLADGSTLVQPGAVVKSSLARFVLLVLAPLAARVALLGARRWLDRGVAGPAGLGAVIALVPEVITDAALGAKGGGGGAEDENVAGIDLLARGA